jgi:hypothetical protein
MKLVPSDPQEPAAARGRHPERGQVVVIFAGAMLLFVLLCAAVIDLSWYWTNNLRMQRAADAAALAGVVFLPGDTASAYAAARAEATKNGFTNGVNNMVVTPLQDPANPRQLRVSISGAVNTFFARVLGIQSWPAAREAKSEYVLPVPMGSPQNYYGVGYFRDAKTTTTTTSSTSHDSDSTGLSAPANTAPSGGQWTFTPTGGGRTVTSVVRSEDNEYAQATTSGHVQAWANFGLIGNITNPAGNETVSITGLQVRFDDAFINTACSNGATATIAAALSWDGGASWSSTISSPALGTNTGNGDYTLGSSSSTSGWGGHTWARGEFTDANFRVRLTFNETCTGSKTLSLDRLRVDVAYDVATTTTTTSTSTDLVDVDMVSPYGDTLAPQNFWAAMQSQGAPNIQGDAYMTKYDSRTGPVSNDVDGTDPDARYAWDDYYSYAIEMPPNSSGGEVWLFDPGFCDGSTGGGTGENWTATTPNGNPNRQPVSAFYTLQDAGTNLYSSADDGSVYSVSSGNTFRRLSRQDDALISETNAADTGAADCGSEAWHFDVNDWHSASPTSPRRGWYLLGSGLTGGPNGTVYRLHSYTTDASNLNDQNGTTALNSFSIYARAGSGGTPKVYGLGAMEAYVRLPGGRASEFYLAKIDAVHAGKTMVVQLWDPGDTGSLSATLEILAPGASSYTPATFSYTAARGTTDAGASACGSIAGTGTAVVTNTGGTSRFNGCWLSIQIAIPSTYSAPHPSADLVTSEGGWWKIRYTMGGIATSFSTDLTTWQVDIRGNPVHLVLP